MSEPEQRATVVELLRREPEIVTLLDERRPRSAEPAEDDDGPPRAA